MARHAITNGVGADHTEFITNGTNDTERAQQFLDEVFSAVGGGGYVAIVEVPGMQGVPQEKRWDAMRQTYLAIRPGIMPQLPDLASGSAWYFSPVVFATQSRNKGAVVEGGCLWVDLDDERVSIDTVTPRPSAVVVSSPGHYHLYWLLTEPLSVANLEYYNRKLAYAVGADRSGWDANQLLRLPAGVNIKRDPPVPVGLLEMHKDLRYDLDAFAMLPEPPMRPGGLADEFASIAGPLPTEHISREVIEGKYSAVMSARLMDFLRRRQTDRSRALWHIYNECSRVGMTPTECYWLVAGTPNDKFAGQRYLAGESLWRDVLGGYAQAAAGQADRGIIDEMTSIRLEKAPQAVKLDKLGRKLVTDMRRVGMFYQTPAGAELFYLDLTPGQGDLIPVELRSQRLRRLVLDRYAINPGTQEYLQLYEHIAARCQDDDPVRVHRFAWYDPDACVLYVNRYDNMMYRVTRTGWEVVPNGADGVLMLNPVNAQPYVAVQRPRIVHKNGASQHPHTSPAPSPLDVPPHAKTTGDSLWFERVVGSCNLPPDKGVSRDGVRHILYTWILALFFKDLMPVKPILLVHGETGSGKTMLFKTILKVLVGPDAKPDAPYADADAFDNAATNNEWLFVDNVDDYSSWLANKLALVATSYGITKRRLYTDNMSVSFNASAFVGITSRTPRFLRDRDDVAERLIPIRVEPYRERLVNEGTLMGELERMRGHLWGELLEDLSSVIGALQDGSGRGRLPKFVGDFRQADFGSLLGLTGGLWGIEPAILYKHIKRLQGVEAVEDDPLLYVLRHWLNRPGNDGREITPAALHAELTTMPGGEEFYKRVPSPRGLTIKIGRTQQYMEAVGIKTTKSGQMSPLYTFHMRG